MTSLHRHPLQVFDLRVIFPKTGAYFSGSRAMQLAALLRHIASRARTASRHHGNREHLSPLGFFIASPKPSRRSSVFRVRVQPHQRRTTMMLRKIRIALVATILALSATATVSIHSPAQAGLTATAID
jgi:hypothetical protein